MASVVDKYIMIKYEDYVRLKNNQRINEQIEHKTYMHSQNGMTEQDNITPSPNHANPFKLHTDHTVIEPTNDDHKRVISSGKTTKVNELRGIGRKSLSAFKRKGKAQVASVRNWGGYWEGIHFPK